MDTNKKYQRIERPKEVIGNNTLVLTKDNYLLSLDPISLYIWEKSTGRTLQDITGLLISACENSTQLCFDEIFEDCSKVISYLVENGLVFREGWDD